MGRGAGFQRLAALFAACLAGCVPRAAKTTATDASTDAEACEERAAAAGSLLVNALLEAGLGCTSDESCQIVGNITNCFEGCGVLTNGAGEVGLAAAITLANATICGDVDANGCFAIPPPCPPRFFPAAACVDGGCVAVPAAAWQELVICEEVADAGTEPLLAAGSTCSGEDASSWAVTPDAAIVVMTPSGTRTGTLSASDFAFIDETLRSGSFRANLTGYPCGAFVPGEQVVFTVTRSHSIPLTFDGTGCVLDASAGDVPAELFAVVQRY
jgi:hypothetical protein